jgi:hypothetical protein
LASFKFPSEKDFPPQTIHVVVEFYEIRVIQKVVAFFGFKNGARIGSPLMNSAEAVLCKSILQEEGAESVT